jgi:hypothetical protein
MGINLLDLHKGRLMKKLILALSFLLLTSTAWAQLAKDPSKQTYKAMLGTDEVIVGDEKSADFKAQVKFTKWNKEESLTIKSDIVGTPQATAKGVKLQNFYFDKHSEELFKFGLILDKKPATNTWTFQLDGWENFYFFYQPPLKNENPDGSTWEGGSHRPADVNGSYAVYHKTKRDYITGQTNYGTGKFGHIYCPKFIDARGESVWANLHIENGVYTISVSPDFLDKAVYPIKANDTFGYGDVGGTLQDFGSNQAYYAKSYTTPSSNGTLTSISYYGRKIGDADLEVALYSDNSGAPNTRLAYTTTGTAFGASNGWVSTDLSYASVTASAQYWFGFGCTSATFYGYYDDVGSGNYITLGGSPFPNPATPGSYYPEWHSIYATYTPASEPTPTPTPEPTPTPAPRRIITISKADAEAEYKDRRCKVSDKADGNEDKTKNFICWKCCEDEKGCLIEGCQLPQQDAFLFWKPEWEQSAIKNERIFV